jgi:3-oxoacyl-[acyl-carrier-protein] synthase-3
MPLDRNTLSVKQEDTMLGIIGVGSFVPPDVRTNAELQAAFKLADGWIERKTGIAERRIADAALATSDLAARAARRAIADAGVRPGEIGLVLCASTAADELAVSTACRVQAAVGLTNAAATDVGGACAGFLFALRMAWGYLRSEPGCRYALVIGTETFSRFLDPADRATSVLFGDGAGAVVIGPVPEPYGLRHLSIATDGSCADIIGIPAGGSRVPASAQTVAEGLHYMRMSGREVADFFAQNFGKLLREAAEAEGGSLESVDLVIPHQANVRLVRELAAAEGVTEEQLVITGDRYGNTGAASIPMALEAARDSGRLRHGSTVVMAAVGVGMSVAGGLLRWYAPTAEATT